VVTIFETLSEEELAALDKSALAPAAVTPAPGPLPLAGALAGLGWSRRLRKRLRRAVSRA
jgi:hypothetical protein